MTNKEKYSYFCKKVYVPIYSKPWWMDAVCLPDNWNVWIYESGGDICAAMPYYVEIKGAYKYITRAPLSQNNGIIFKINEGSKRETRARFQEHVIDAANEYIDSLVLDVYEQQYHYTFDNWLPFFWNQYTAITRYTYVLEDTSDIELMWGGVSSSYRNMIKKGYKMATVCEGSDGDEFWELHKNVFLKQGLKCPFTYDVWTRLYNACIKHNCGKILYAKDARNNITSILFLTWDEQSVYQLLGGSMPEYQYMQTYDMLIWEGIKFASQMGLKYDFEGSVIKRISKSMRQFGGVPKPYFRIRKVFNPDIVRAEAETQIRALSGLLCRKSMPSSYGGES